MVCALTPVRLAATRSSAPESVRSSSAACLFMSLNMLKKPLFLPGVREAVIPVPWMNSGFTAFNCSTVLPLRPFTSNATKPLEISASESPRNVTVPSSSRMACTYTVLRQPGTLFSGVLSSSGIGLSFAASARSCWYLSLSLGSDRKAVATAASFAGSPNSAAKSTFPAFLGMAPLRLLPPTEAPRRSPAASGAATQPRPAL
mmetsp:Transcript_8603/g.25374  ORF Transcript_8603/g.25374 Transcript_8603/m.25374 type:complete len:202 (+) Transcript_8603:1441-2046(+)